jgi:cyclophilin family peptidyl-prolyl cis-trans isomerase
MDAGEHYVGKTLWRSVGLGTTLLVFAACAEPQQEPGVLLDPNHSEWQTSAPDRFDVVFETSEGEVVIAVTREWAPNGADRFFNLVRLGYYDDARFHRTVPDFIVQFGLAGKPAVSRAWREQFIPDDTVVVSNTRGRVAFAFTEPGTRATQVFISMVELSRLDDGGFAPFGEGAEGMDVVDRLYSGYGEDSGGGLRGGDQSSIFAEGNAWLDREYPELSRLVRARIRG